VHIVVPEIAAGAAEIAATAAAKGCSNKDKYKSRERPSPGGPDRMAHLRHFKCPLSGAPTATATGSCTFFRPAPAALVGWTFDPDNGKDQYGSHAIAWSAIQGRPPRSCIRRKFNDGAHVPFSLVAART
jgi:hypothetical protein